MSKTWRIEFTEEELSEIYYSLETKASLLEQGKYGQKEKGDRVWAAQLREIMEKIMESGAAI